MNAEELRVWRARRNITREKAAEELKIAPATLSRYENGITPIPHVVDLAIQQLDSVRDNSEAAPEA